MNIELNLTLFGVRLHICTGVAKVGEAPEVEVVELEADTRIIGFQPNEEVEDDDE